MKLKYEKPLAEVVKFETAESVMNGETGLPGITTSGEGVGGGDGWDDLD